MNIISEILIGFGMMLESAIQVIKANYFKSAFLFLTALFCAHSFLARAAHDKILRITRLIAFALILLTCISAFAYFRQKTLHAYETLVPNLEPGDLRCNFTAAMEDSLYDTTLNGDKSTWINGMPSVFMPPVFALYRFSSGVLGDRFETYYKNYRMCGVISAAIIVLILAVYTCKHLGRKSIVEIVLIAFSINIFLFLLPLLVMDIRLGNTNTFVGLLVAIQLLFVLWEHPFSKVCQAFFLALAWWIKPNMILVIWCLMVFSISRKQYTYLIGLACGGIIPFVTSLFAKNISFETYFIYFTKISKIVEQASLHHVSNLSMFIHVSNPIMAYRIALILIALFVLLYAAKIKDKDFLGFEITCFMLTYVFWPRVWGYYLIPVAIMSWANVVNRIEQGKQIFFEVILVLMLSYSLAMISGPFVNIALLLSAAVCFAQHVSSVEKQIVVGPGTA